MAQIKVHGVMGSTDTMRVLACLYEKEVEFEFVHVDIRAGEHKKEPFISLNVNFDQGNQPFGQVPAIEDGPLKLFESRAITLHIVHKYAVQGNRLISPDPMKMAILGVWLEVEAHQYNLPASKLTLELVEKPLLGLTTDQAIVEENQEKLARVLDVYERKLAQSKYLADESFTLADLHHLPTIQSLMGTSLRKLFECRPNVAAWVADITGRPVWAKVLTMDKGK